MADFLDRIRRAWQTSKLYKRRVSILLMSNDRNYTLERICHGMNDEILKEAPLIHISALGERCLKERGAVFAQIPVNVEPSPIDKDVSMIQTLCGDAGKSGIFIVDDFLTRLNDRDAAHDVPPAGKDRQYFYDLFEKTLETNCLGQVIIFLEHAERREFIPDIVDAEIQIIEHPYPNHDEVREIISKEIENYKTRSKKTIGSEERFINDISPHLCGFAYSTISWMVRDAIVKHQPSSPSLDDNCIKKVIAEVKEQKEDLISRQLGMKVMKSITEQPIGVERLLAYIEKRKNRICIPGSERLKGLLLIGPPGTGKSMLAKYLSGILNKPAVEVRLSSLMSRWMGETENLFQRLTDVLDAMAPVIVYMDEIEKMFSDEGGGSSAGASMVRATGRLLSWMNDTVAPIFIIATANNIARMGEIGLTMTRRGRFDALYYVGYPDKEGRKKLFQHYAGELALNKDQIDDLAVDTRFFTGADIAGVVQECLAECAGTSSPDYYTTLQESIRLHAPRAEAMRAMYAAHAGGPMRELAIPAGNLEEES